MSRFIRFGLLLLSLAACDSGVRESPADAADDGRASHQGGGDGSTSDAAGRDGSPAVDGAPADGSPSARGYRLVRARVGVVVDGEGVRGGIRQTVRAAGGGRRLRGEVYP